MEWVVFIGAALGLLTLLVLCTRRGMGWGATPEERASTGTGDSWFEGVPGSRLRMTRAISINAPSTTVWSWLAQTGRGAGWSSYDRLDNGGRSSARHIVSWIPEPCVGDAAAIGYLRHLECGRAIVWWAPDIPFLGSRTWSAWEYRVIPAGDGSRLLMRVDAAAAGAVRVLVLLVLPLMDTVMAVRQLRNLKDRAERYGTRGEDPDNPETGKRDQYQQHHTIYASGEEAGVPGFETARTARKRAESDGVV